MPQPCRSWPSSTHPPPPAASPAEADTRQQDGAGDPPEAAAAREERDAAPQPSPHTESDPADRRPAGTPRPHARPPSTDPPTPTDYTTIPGLSEPVFPKTVRDTHRVPMHDGIELYVEVVRPDPEIHGEGPWPVIMEASPYHGTLADRDGIRIFPDPKDADGNPIGLTGYFAPRGYAVAMVNLRGTGRSGGCLDHLGPDDAADLRT
ncbi:MAG: CocE/NonD family hydrolase [Egibacteraceae bacterium]